MTFTLQRNKECDSYDIWRQIKIQIVAECPHAEYWLKNVNLRAVGSDIVVLSSRGNFTKDWIERHYIDVILKKWRLADPSVEMINIIMDNKEGLSISPLITNSATETETTPSEQDAQSQGIAMPAVHYKPVSPIEFGSPLDPRFTFDSFVVAKPNEFAFNAVRAVAENDGPLPNSNPLFLRGDVGLGKTHLMHAAGWFIKQNNSKRRVVYLSAEKFMYQFINSLRNKDIFSFKEYFRSADVLMVDDIQFIGGKESTQEEFFHTFNELINSNKQLVFSADRPPCELQRIEERVRSRLNCGLVVDVNATTFELRLGILQSKVKDIAIDIPNNILEYLAANIVSNVRELEGALNRIVAYSRYNNQNNLSIEIINSILSDMLNNARMIVTVDNIRQKVAEYFSISIPSICGTSRAKKFTIPRQVAMYLSKHLTTKSFPEIGRAFGGRDHTTVMHACKKIENLKQKDKQIIHDIEALKKKLYQA